MRARSANAEDLVHQERGDAPAAVALGHRDLVDVQLPGRERAERVAREVALGADRDPVEAVRRADLDLEVLALPRHGKGRALERRDGVEVGRCHVARRHRFGEGAQGTVPPGTVARSASPPRRSGDRRRSRRTAPGRRRPRRGRRRRRGEGARSRGRRRRSRRPRARASTLAAGAGCGLLRQPARAAARGVHLAPAGVEDEHGVAGPGQGGGGGPERRNEDERDAAGAGEAAAEGDSGAQPREGAGAREDGDAVEVGDRTGRSRRGPRPRRGEAPRRPRRAERAPGRGRPRP